MAGVVRSAVWMIALGSAPMAAAQEDIRFDATGPDAPPLVGDGPVTLWSADGMRRGETRFAGLFEGAGGLLELTNAAGEDLARGVTFASGLNLSGAWAPIDRFGLGATASAWTLAPGGRIAVGALRVDAPIRVPRKLQMRWLCDPATQDVWPALAGDYTLRGKARAA